ncbi:glutathione S-transferase [Gyrodon lividus]|nr:glutathione S-transferase [Gyrodon lividus]
MSAQLTLYGFKASPFSEKIELALKEGNIPHKFFSVDLFDKPAFFAAEVNPVGKVPVITYGGPDVSPEHPSPLSTKLAESDVILDFLADAYPEANLLPADPIQRAKVRFFINAVTTKLNSPYFAWVRNSEPQAEENFLKAIEFVQDLLPEPAKFAVGDSYTIADACVTPYFHRLLINIESDIGKFPAGGGPRFGELLNAPKYAKFMAYLRAMLDRPIAKEVFDAETVKSVWAKIFGRS